MKESMTQYSRRRGTWLLVALIAVIVALPVAAIAGYWVSSAIGRTTEVQAPDGSTKTLYWREYPGTAELDPREVLDGPTPQQGLAAGERMITEIQEALDREFSLNWTPIQPTHEQGPFNTPVSNDFGGYSLLTNVNGPERQSTTVPPTWASKQQAMDIINAVLLNHDYGALELQSPDGGSIISGQVVIWGMSTGPVGQWLTFGLQDVSLDVDGSFAKRELRMGNEREMTSWISLSYGANGLLPAEHRKDFISRLEPFLGLDKPEAVES